MKTEALNYAIAAAVFAVGLKLVMGIHADVDVGSILGWATVGVLLAMALMDYRRLSKRISSKA